MAEDSQLSLQTFTHLSVADDIRRAREVYRHVQPHHILPILARTTGNGNGHDENAATGLRDVLEPYVQLASLRCNAQRAFITLIDRESQYFLAEASRPTNANPSKQFEKHEDLLWLGCEGISKSGKLCEMTIRLPPAVDPSPLFQVNDLSQDPRFSQLPFVQGKPYFRFYAGTPLTTKRGINIGSLCVMDVEPREGFSQEHHQVLGWLAGLVMNNLERNREAIEGRRSKLMSSALNVFIDGKSRMKPLSEGDKEGEPTMSEAQPQDRTPPEQGGRKRTAERNHNGLIKSDELSGYVQTGDHHDVEGRLEDYRTAKRDRATTSSDPSSDEEDFGGHRQEEAVSRSHRFTFGRAANILRECFEMAEGDGVFFLEAGTGLTYGTSSGLATSTFDEARDGNNTKDEQDDLPKSPTHQIGTSTSFDPLTSAFAKHAKNPAPVLASSTEREPFQRGKYPAGHAALGDIDQDILYRLFKSYPQGKIWVMESGAAASSSEDDSIGNHIHTTSSSHRKRSQHRRGSILANLLPEARQILFVPLWDAEASRWGSGCFMWSTSETRIYSTGLDLGFLSAFGKTIMVECSRLDALLADKQKADFIGSISHELRSPLHGVLAGAEFLTETATSAFQKSLIDTVEACGRTLLDTINHVLDFSKINSLDRNWRNKKQPRKRLTERQIGPGAQMSAKQLPSGAPPLLRLYAVTDIAAVTEEVVEGLSIGQIYSQATDLTDISAMNRGRGAEKGVSIAPRTHGGRQDGKQTNQDTIEVLIDIAKEDWVFMAQPGAIRRIIMNLFGNSIKYTSSGTIKVQLGLASVPGSDPEHAGKMMVLTVSDTGKGISARFLSSRLFVPFAQENTLSPGTGLGLSIVRSMVTMMGGSIELRSRLGEGTTVQVTLPLMRPPPGSESTQTTPRSTSTGAPRHDSVQLLREEAAGCTVAIYEYFHNDRRTETSREYAEVLVRYITDWYGFETWDWDVREKADVLIIEERDIPEIVRDGAEAGSNGFPALVVLCSNATRHYEAEADTSGSQLNGVYEYISKPCGPHKLARALRSCLEKVKLLNPTHIGVFETLPTAAKFESLGELDLPALNETEACIAVQANSTVSASRLTRNAQMAIHAQSADIEGNANEFPFPMDRSCSIASPLSPEVQNLSKLSKTESGNSLVAPSGNSGPRILLVDDNKINLQLLQTFMHKQKYYFTDSAEDGTIAVNAVKAAEKPYDIIFMDISMPVMNGFEATRLIRSFEAENKHKPAMIIALTGLASGRDQAEGFSCGCDIYMTKPVSFRELAKLLKNWEGNMDAIRNTEDDTIVTMGGGLAKEGDAD